MVCYESSGSVNQTSGRVIMGLGPPVCQHCQVIGICLDTPVPIIRTEQTTTFNKMTSWICPICGNTDLTEHAGMGGVESWKKYKDNEKFLSFMLDKPYDYERNRRIS